MVLQLWIEFETGEFGEPFPYQCLCSPVPAFYKADTYPIQKQHYNQKYFLSGGELINYIEQVYSNKKRLPIGHSYIPFGDRKRPGAEGFETFLCRCSARRS